MRGNIHRKITKCHIYSTRLFTQTTIKQAKPMITIKTSGGSNVRKIGEVVLV